MVWIIVFCGGGGLVKILVVVTVLITGTVSVVTEVRKLVTVLAGSGTVLVTILVLTTVDGVG